MLRWTNRAAPPSPPLHSLCLRTYGTGASVDAGDSCCRLVAVAATKPRRLLEASRSSARRADPPAPALGGRCRRYTVTGVRTQQRRCSVGDPVAEHISCWQDPRVAGDPRPAELVRAHVSAFNERELVGLLDGLSLEVVWQTGGDTFVGRAEVGALMAAAFERLTPSLEIRSVDPRRRCGGGRDG